MKREEIQQIVTPLVEAQLLSNNIQPADLLVEKHHADSLDLIEIGILLEDRFEMEIPADRYQQFHTVENIVMYLESRIGELNPVKVNPAIPRRAHVEQWCPAEHAIAAAIDEVEKMGADIRLTEAVILLGHAQSRVGDFVDGVKADGKGA